MRGGRARLIDFDNPANNDFLVVRQLTIAGANGKTIRPDLVLYVNGLPLVVIELKDPANTAADLNMAIDQFGRYKDDRAGPVRAEPAAGGQRRAADAGGQHHQRAAAVHAVAAGERAASRRWRR